MTQTQNPPLIALIGPTAVGKTTLSIRLARRFGGEIVSADSRQIYRGMNIGSAKATAAERAAVPHHLLDVTDPDQPLNVATYQQLAYRAIDEIIARGHLPFLVGGSGLYVRAVLDGLRIPAVPPRPALRTVLAEIATERGAPFLHRWLAAMDAQAAARIDYRNVRRVIRAVEVILVSGRPISPAQRLVAPAYHILRIGLTRPRPELYRRIDERVDAMLAAGLVTEVQELLDAGYTPDLPAMSGIGYRQICAYLRGEITLAEAVQEIKRRTRRFLRQQATWFRLDDPRIHWFDLAKTAETDIFSLIETFIA